MTHCPESYFYKVETIYKGQAKPRIKDEDDGLSREAWWLIHVYLVELMLIDVDIKIDEYWPLDLTC